LFGFFQTFSWFLYIYYNTLYIVISMKTKKTKITGIILLVLSVTFILTGTGILIYYLYVSEDSDYDSFCQDCPPITQEELDAGWYYGFINQKKPGTPDTWIHVGGDSLSARWVDPNLISDIINQSCPPITHEELAAGWYYGELNQKKPGTPDTWLHKGEGTRSAMWFDPYLVLVGP
jgi:hypothetical protein